jgi:hypothetical protein
MISKKQPNIKPKGTGREGQTKFTVNRRRVAIKL